MTPTALLLIAHGSRRPEANADLDHLAGVMRARGSTPWSQPAYLELCEPGIVAGGEMCVAAGASGGAACRTSCRPGFTWSRTWRRRGTNWPGGTQV